MSRERQEYEDLTVKYELLEEEHVVTKAQMVMEKEKIQSQLVLTNREVENLSMELKTLKETFSSKQDAWIREKLNLQVRASVYFTIFNAIQLRVGTKNSFRIFIFFLNQIRYLLNL